MIEFESDYIVDYSIDFYKVYPEYLGIFKAPSAYMWSLTYLFHPNSPLRELPYKRMIEEINRIAPEHFDPDEYTEDTVRFQEFVTLWPKRFIQRWRRKLDERQDYIDSLPYTEDNMSLLETLLKNTKPIWEAYHQAESQLNKEEGSHVSGNLEESASEKGII